MPDIPRTHDERIKKDLEELKNEILHLTKAERRLILKEYEILVKEYTGINMKEYSAFVEFLLDMEEENDRSE